MGVEDKGVAIWNCPPSSTPIERRRKRRKKLRLFDGQELVLQRNSPAWGRWYKVLAPVEGWVDIKVALRYDTVPATDEQLHQVVTQRRDRALERRCEFLKEFDSLRVARLRSRDTNQSSFARVVYGPLPPREDVVNNLVPGGDTKYTQ